jgi:hypothetical protein
MRIFLAGAVAIALGGCVSTAELDAQDNQTCSSYGFKRGTQDYLACRMAVQDQRRKADEAQRQRWAAASVLLNQPAPVYQPRQINCTSVRQGVFVNTNCY